MPLTFFEFATLTLLASISYWLMHETIKREAVEPEGQGGVKGYWGLIIGTSLLVAVPVAFVLGGTWLMFFGVNWLFSLYVELAY